jgi:hypothetical protein
MLKMKNRYLRTITDYLSIKESQPTPAPGDSGFAAEGMFSACQKYAIIVVEFYPSHLCT